MSGTTTKVVDREYLKAQFKNFNDILVKPKIQDLDDRKMDKVAGKGLSTNDFTDDLKTKLEGLSNYDDTDLVNAINTLNGDINTNGSVAKITADAVAAIVANAPADFDTLKEISDWISSHADSAAAMNSAIQANTQAITLLNSDENTEGSVAHAVKQAVDSLAYEIEDSDIDFTTLDNIIITGDNSVLIGNTLTLVSSVSGVTWSSSDDTVATVDQSGVITPVSAGNVTITAAKSGYTSGTKAIEIPEQITMNFIEVDNVISYDTPDKAKREMTGNHFSLPVMSGDYGNFTAVTDANYTSSDPNVAIVEPADGGACKITFVGPGSVTIRASKPGYTNADACFDVVSE